MKKIIGLIPARSGSKGIPHKNIVNLGGLPLIEYSIRACKRSKLSDCFCSSDSEEILDIGEKLGSKIIKRPIEYATDLSSMLGVVKHFRDVTISLDWDAVYLLYPTYPYRDEHLIDSAINVYEKNSNNSLIGFHIAYTHPYLCYTLADKNISQIIDFDINKNYRRQHYPQIYELCLAVCIIPRNEIDNLNNQLYNTKTKSFIINNKKSILNIDTIEDLKYAEFLIQTDSS